MRIAQVAPLYESVPPALYGGTERVVFHLTEELVRAGHEVTLFASGDSRTSARLVPVAPAALRLTGVVDSLAYHVLLLEEVFSRIHTFDVVHFHTDYLHFPLSRRSGVPQLTTLHGRLDLPDLRPLYEAFPDMPLVSISDAQRRPLPKAHWVGTVHHGLPTDLFRFSPGPGEYLAFLGRVSPEKGLDRAIEVATRCGKRLRIAAKVDRADREYFRTQIEPLLGAPGIEFLGEIGEDQKSSFLGGAEALLVPVNWEEPFGLVMIEAMACGTPVVAWPRGSVPELVKEGVTGLLARSVDEAVEAVGRIGGIPRAGCRREFERRFTARRMADDYLALYQSVAGLRSGRATA